MTQTLSQPIGEPAEVVLVHGISHKVCGSWRSAMQTGLARAGFGPAGGVDARCVVYCDLTMPGEPVRPLHPATDIAVLPEESVPRRMPRPALRTLGLVSRRSTFLTDLVVFGIGQRFITRDLVQVRRYFTEPGLREAAHARLADAITPGTAVLVGFSFGSVIAYEALCRHPEWPVRTLLTVGSPLGIGKLVFTRLDPEPIGGVGRWPGSVERWVNVSDDRDVVCLASRLSERFGPRVEDRMVHNGLRPHDLNHYLATPEAGRAIAAGLEHRAAPLAVGA